MSSPQPINKKLSCLNAVKRRRNNTSRPAVPSIAYVYSCRDRSGSMSSYGSAAGQSLFDSIQDHKKNSTDNNVTVMYSLTTFDTKAEHPYENVNIQSISMTLEEAQAHVSPRDLTRLYSTAIEELAKLRRAIKEEKSKNPNINVVGVFELHTDGIDNESRPFTSKDLNSAVKAARDEGITCIFAGANQDAVTVGEQYGFDPHLSLTTDSSQVNATQGLRIASAAVMRACSGAPAQFTRLERHTSAPVGHSFDVTPPTSPTSPISSTSPSPTTMAAGAALLAMRNGPPTASLRSTPLMMMPPPPLTRQTNQRIV